MNGQGTHVRSSSGAVATRRLIPSVGLHMTQGLASLAFSNRFMQLETTFDDDPRRRQTKYHRFRARRSIGMPLETTWIS